MFSGYQWLQLITLEDVSCRDVYEIMHQSIADVDDINKERCIKVLQAIRNLKFEILDYLGK